VSLGFDNAARMKILELEARNYELEYMLSHQRELATSSRPSQQQHPTILEKIKLS
jgi:hypothetical protein